MKVPILNLFTTWRDLLDQLVAREIKARYKQSILGYAWVVLVPLIKLVVMTIVFSAFFRIKTDPIPYPLFLFTALVPWTFTAGAVSVATSSLMANSSLITKIKLPREIFPITSILVKVVDFALSFVVLFALMLVFKYPFHLTILLIPVIFLIQFILIMGVSFILSALNVFYRDVENLLEVFLLVWMYMTPVFYPPEFIPAQYQMLFNLNPMMGIINAYRNVVLYGVLPPAMSFGYATVLSILIFLAGYLFFIKRSKYFADVL
jgi:ABC-type polysaccharide/polyol phosphate export permease